MRHAVEARSERFVFARGCDSVDQRLPFATIEASIRVSEGAYEPTVEQLLGGLSISEGLTGRID